MVSISSFYLFWRVNTKIKFYWLKWRLHTFNFLFINVYTQPPVRTIVSNYVAKLKHDHHYYKARRFSHLYSLHCNYDSLHFFRRALSRQFIRYICTGSGVYMLMCATQIHKMYRLWSSSTGFVQYQCDDDTVRFGCVVLVYCVY